MCEELLPSPHPDRMSACSNEAQPALDPWFWLGEAHYSEQISRAYRARGRESEQLWRERVCLEAQQQLPVTDPPF
jgi:hypothetical protein